ncbi:MAG: AAA-associated domain-containing protein, partial [Pseudobdellovibrio sp.]
LVLGSNPGHIKAEVVNTLPYPRVPDTAPFIEMVSKIHGLITDTYIPDTPVAETVQKLPKQAFIEILPDINILDMVGLIEAISNDGGAVDVFVLAADIGKDFGTTLYIVKAAELLGFVDTPKQQVVLTKNGQLFATSDVNGRKKMMNEMFSQLLIVQKTTEILKESENIRIPVEQLKHQVHQWLPNEDPDRIVATIIAWGRYAEYFGYNDNTKSVYLDVGQEIV